MPTDISDKDNFLESFMLIFPPKLFSDSNKCYCPNWLIVIYFITYSLPLSPDLFQ